MLRLAHGRVSSVNFDAVRNELNICDEVLVAFLNLREGDMFALYRGLLSFVLFFIGHLGDLNLATT